MIVQVSSFRFESTSSMWEGPVKLETYWSISPEAKKKLVLNPGDCSFLQSINLPCVQLKKTRLPQTVCRKHLN